MPGITKPPTVRQVGIRLRIVRGGEAESKAWGVIILTVVIAFGFGVTIPLMSSSTSSALPIILAFTLMVSIFAVGFRAWGSFFLVFALSLASIDEAWLVWHVGNLRLQPYKLLTIVSLALLLFQVATKSRSLRRTPLLGPILAYMASGVVSIIMSPVPEVSLRIWMGGELAAFIPYFLIVQYCDTDKRIGITLKAMVVAGTVVAAVNILITFLYYMVPGIPLGGFLYYGDLRGRGMWPFAEATLLGNFLAMMCVLLVGTVRSLPSYVNSKYWSIAWVIVFLALILNQTRAAWIGVAFGLGAYLILSPYRKSFLRRFTQILLVTITCIVLVAAGNIIFSSIGAFDSIASSLVSRLHFDADYQYNPDDSAASHLFNSIAILREVLTRPLAEQVFGQGIGSRNVVYADRSYRIGDVISDQGKRGGSASSLPLMIVYERGLVGLVILLWFLFDIVKLVRTSIIISRTGSWGYTCLSAIPIALLGVLVTDTVFGNIPWLVPKWIVLGLLGASALQARAKAARKSV